MKKPQWFYEVMSSVRYSHMDLQSCTVRFFEGREYDFMRTVHAALGEGDKDGWDMLRKRADMLSKASGGTITIESTWGGGAFTADSQRNVRESRWYALGLYIKPNMPNARVMARLAKASIDGVDGVIKLLKAQQVEQVKVGEYGSELVRSPKGRPHLFATLKDGECPPQAEAA